MTNNPDLSSPESAQPGRGAAGNDHWAVQTAQPTDVNAPDERIPSGVDVEGNVHDLEAAVEAESDTDLKTTDGYVITESGQINNFAIEPPMYYEDNNGNRVDLPS
ncbi:hypothetical protein IQ250_18205 [Pseudanabaenaceae cyanobacterium LEGE 13415]|nr:hypothetical protein [Pseudanabaenaceae cyanobacterium LEGE 13415]